LKSNKINKPTESNQIKWIRVAIFEMARVQSDRNPEHTQQQSQSNHIRNQAKKEKKKSERKESGSK